MEFRRDVNYQEKLGMENGQCTHPGSSHLAIGQHEFHATVCIEMIPKRHGGITVAVIQGITCQDTLTWIGTILHQIIAVLFNTTIQVKIQYPRLNKNIMIFIIYFQDANYLAFY